MLGTGLDQLETLTTDPLKKSETSLNAMAPSKLFATLRMPFWGEEALGTLKAYNLSLKGRGYLLKYSYKWKETKLRPKKKEKTLLLANLRFFFSPWFSLGRNMLFWPF